MNSWTSVWTTLTSAQTMAAVGQALWQHLYIAGAALALGVVVGVPIGIVSARVPWVGRVFLYSAGAMQTVPSLALLAVMIPVFGIGAPPAIAALFLYALFPIIQATYTGLAGVDPAMAEAARGMGMTSLQQLWLVEMPLALRVIVTGIRVAAVLVIGWATLAAYIGAGGLGQLILEGFAQLSYGYILAGAIPVSLLAIGVDASLGWIESRLGRGRWETAGG